MPATFTEVRTPFTNLSWSPDVPSAALTANEYNSGQNVETDTRGIRSVFGDEEILNSLPGKPIFISGGYRTNNDDATFNDWYFIVCCISNVNQGRWYSINYTGTITNVTPGYGLSSAAYLPGYYDDMPITDSWNGTVLVINDSVNAPMFLVPPNSGTPNGSEFVPYSNTPTIQLTAVSGNGSVVTLTYATQPSAPFTVGQQITVVNCYPTDYNGTYTVATCSTTQTTFLSTTSAAVTFAGQVQPRYQWNYNPNWAKLTAGFVRLYNTPNVGSILIAGNLTATDHNGNIFNYPTTVRWSQTFALDNVPLTWQPTVTNVANELEIPVRGAAVDGFPTNGNFYVCSYWDTVVFNPLNYQTTNTPVLGVRLINQGRGLLNENCSANADGTVYGLDARDFWAFDGNNFKGIGNQRVRDYFFANLNANYNNRVFVVNNTKKSQIEVYYPSLTSNGWCDEMIGYRYDLDIWNPPRQISEASHATEAPVYQAGADSTMLFNFATRTVVYCRGIASTKLVQKDQGYSFIDNGYIQSIFRRDNINLGLKFSQQALLHRLLPEVINIQDNGLPVTSDQDTATITVTLGGSNSTGQQPVDRPSYTMDIATNNPWAQADQNAFRVVSVQLDQSSRTHAWQCTAVNWQFTPTEDAR